MTMRSAVTGAHKSIVELQSQESNDSNLFDCLHLCAYGRTNKCNIEIVFVDYILPIYAAILRQMMKCIALCQAWQLFD